ncbi:acyltransferase [Companilactobacillus zhachilii]|uniref:Acyltransferase n=1 Tax=Companilactobacillus zhachilii TaxID=2304606 RepID=A0A386PXM7_9LACO|nr:acyltransferase [Companilactobacillus zhachilii]AYE39513.1 acyltransferase [Companilactobacillus zhachilii]
MKRKRIIYIDVIRVVAMMLVVLAHSLAARLATRDNSLNWDISNMLVVITEIAVPLFFMISGATILNSRKTKNVGYLFSHRLPRVLVPFLIWSVISAFVSRKIDGVFTYQDFFHSVLLMYHQPVLIAYWFIYPLVSLYLLSPLLKAMVEGMDEKLLNYLLILWLIISMFLPALVGVLPKNISMYFDGYTVGKVVFSSSLGYFILGYKLTQSQHEKTNSLQLLVMAVVLMAINVIIAFVSLKPNFQFLSVISVVNIPFIAALIFKVLKSYEGRYHKWFIRLTEILAPLTYGVYLVHGLSIGVVQKMAGVNHYLITFFFATILSLVIIFVISKIPVLKKWMM